MMLGKRPRGRPRKYPPFQIKSTGLSPVKSLSTQQKRQYATWDTCAYCNKAFFDKRTLKRHMQRHYADREKFECDVCHRTYTRKDGLKRHKEMLHMRHSLPVINSDFLFQSYDIKTEQD